jgi:transcriptional regulator with XRE-family HTH domain
VSDGLHQGGPGAPAEDGLANIIGDNLRRLRSRSNLSLEKLARASGVSRAMLGQIELGKSVPTVTVLVRIAGAFSLPVTVFMEQQGGSRVTLLPRDESKELKTQDGAFVSRALFPFSGARKTEFYELQLAPGCVEESEAHGAATTENLVVVKGSLEIRVGEERHRLQEGDAIFFAADIDHAYCNTGTESAVAYLVINYPESITY